KDEMAKAGCSIADIAAGMYAYTNILSALLLRGKTGKGSRIDVSMLESMVEWMNFPLYYAFEDQEPPVRAGAAHAVIYPYGPFPTGGDQTIMLGLQNEREWKVFCEQVLGKPELATDERFANNTLRTANRDALKQIIVDAFASMSKEQVIELLETAKIANASVNDMKGVWEHEQLKSRDRWREMDSPVGKLPTLLPPGVNNAYEYRIDAVPDLGEHSEKILGELGYDAQTIAGWREQGVV
ncbi:MAG: CaiB/BaiF CoA-transferase family protein, partial [Advenella sp.]|nr:CaiB/BaiF CoA-transferase family protein [Advenella sp.]